MSDINLRDPDELIAAAADFSSLPLYKKHELVTEVMCRSQNYRSQDVRFKRRKRKESVEHYETTFPSLQIKELMTICGLDQTEAKASIKAYGYRSRPFYLRLILKSFDVMGLKDEKLEPCYYNEEVFADTKFSESDDHDKREPRPKLDAEERKNMLANVESYRMQIQKGMENRKKSEINQSGVDGVCVETTRSLDAKERKNMLANVETRRNLANKAMFRYLCTDGKTVHVDPRCCYESESVCWELTDTQRQEKEIRLGVEEGDIGKFRIPAEIPSPILEIVNDFCISRFEIVEAYAGRDDDDLFSNMLEVFDCSFVQNQPLLLLVQLFHAAYELRIKSLFNLTRNAIVDMLDGKSAEEIRTIFNMPGFTHKAWEEPFPRVSWPYKQMTF